MEPGLKYTSTTVVDPTNVAATVGSGDLPVFATPAMIALMENAATHAVENELPDEQTTVGTLINVVHSRASAIGEQITATAELKEVDGRKLIFHVSAADSKGIIGEGVHERFVIDVVKFMDKVNRVG